MQCFGGIEHNLAACNYYLNTQIAVFRNTSWTDSLTLILTLMRTININEKTWATFVYWSYFWYLLARHCRRRMLFLIVTGIISCRVPRSEARGPGTASRNSFPDRETITASVRCHRYSYFCQSYHFSSASEHGTLLDKIADNRHQNGSNSYVVLLKSASSVKS